MKPIELQTDRDIAVDRDQAGVPHVRAASWHDALFGLGYMHGLDRGTQLQFARSIASGRAAEEIAAAEELLETDRFFRRLGLHRNGPQAVADLDESTRQDIDAYCGGVNAGLQGLGRTWPMWATGFSSRPWDAEAVLLIGKLLSFGGLAISQLHSERLLLGLIHAKVNPRALQELFAQRLDGVDFALLRQVKMSNELSDDALKLITDLPRLTGSNAWAVAPHRSRSGGALLASDPHLEVNRLPAIWYEAVLNWDAGGYVAGATLPGCPLFAVARTAQLAWGVTYMRGDTIDFFIEDSRPGDSGDSSSATPDAAAGSPEAPPSTSQNAPSVPPRWQFRRGEQWLDYACRRETIHRKGEPAEEMWVYENDQGILEADPNVLGAGLLLSVAWTGRRDGGGGSLAAWLRMIHCATVAQAMEVARSCPQPTLCWVMADAQGDIALQACGTFPIRGGGHNGLTPIPAWDAVNHWRGRVAPSELPFRHNPPEGFVASANEECNTLGHPLFVTQPASDYRWIRIRERLDDLPQATLEDMQRLQYDVVSVQARDLLADWLPLLPASELKTRLAAWNYEFTPDSREASLFMRLYRNMILQVLGDQQGIGWRRMVYLCTRAGYSQMVLTAADRLMLREDSFWWHGRDKAELVRRAGELVDVPSAPPWSQVNYFHFTDRYFGDMQVGRLLGYQSRRYAMPGCPATPFQGHVLMTAKRESTFAPSYHFVTDMSEAGAWTNLPGGPSENRFSKFYRSDVQRWVNGEYKQLQPWRLSDTGAQ